MKLKYVSNPKLINQRTDVASIVAEILLNGETGRWVEVRVSDDKTMAQYNAIYASYMGAKKRYPTLEWSIHKGRKHFVLVARKNNLREMVYTDSRNEMKAKRAETMLKESAQ